MDFHNAGISVLDELEHEAWQPVSPTYATELRITLSAYGLLLVAFPWFFYLVGKAFPVNFIVTENVVAVTVLIVLALVWVPKRVRFTQYLLRELDISMQKGCWWRTTVSVAINRIQHLEITQGPIERVLGLSRLALYTAGGFQSDLKLPGLEIETARKLKAHLLKQTAREEVDEELL